MVEVFESSFVVPSHETPKHSIWLSNLDLLLSPRYTTIFHVYRPNGEGDFFALERLKAALAETLVSFYPFAGRLVVGDDGRFELRCTGEGVLLVAASCASALDVLGDFSPSPEMERLLLPSESQRSEVPTPPCVLIMIQVTYFKCGGVCLGTALHHTAADGAATLHFINTWSEANRGIKPTATLALDRSSLRARSPPTPLFDHIEYHCGGPRHPPSMSITSFPATAVLKLSEAQVASLKNSCGDNTSASTFQAVMAHVWRCTCKARELEPDQETRLYIGADVRNRLEPPLPIEYFGNALVRTSAAASVGEMLSERLCLTADRVQHAIVRLNNRYVRSIIDFMELLEDVKGMHVEARGRSKAELWAISLLHLPVYEADFGWGKPAFFGRAMLNVCGLVYVAHSSAGDGSVMVTMAFEEEKMARFKEVFYGDLEELESETFHPRSKL